MFLELIVMSIIQGLTEFIPVSSSGHLLFLQSVFNIKEMNLFIDVFLHLATFLVICIYYFPTLFAIGRDVIKAPFHIEQSNIKLFYLIIITNIPTIITALIVKKYFSFIFIDVNILLITWIVMAILLIISDKIKGKNISINQLTVIQCLVIGLCQGIAVLPGISRSGSTIIIALFLGLRREETAKFSFLISIPALLGAFILELKDISSLSINLMHLISALIITFIFGFAAIHLLIKIITKNRLKYFGFYLIAVWMVLFMIKIL